MYLVTTQKVLSSTLLREDVLLEPPRPGVCIIKNRHILSEQDEKNISLKRHGIPPKKIKKPPFS
jgi:hypothetical protein